MAGQTSYSSNIFTLSSTPVNVFKGKAWYNPDDGYLRIYQNDEVIVHIPESEDIVKIMQKIVSLDKLLEKIDEEV